MNEIHKRTVISVPAPAAPTYQGWSPCIEWCWQTFGDHGWWYMTEGIFEFIEPAHATLFALRWK